MHMAAAIPSGGYERRMGSNVLASLTMSGFQDDAVVKSTNEFSANYAETVQ